MIQHRPKYLLFRLYDSDSIGLKMGLLQYATARKVEQVPHE